MLYSKHTYLYGSTPCSRATKLGGGGGGHGFRDHTTAGRQPPARDHTIPHTGEKLSIGCGKNGGQKKKKSQHFTKPPVYPRPSGRCGSTGSVKCWRGSVKIVRSAGKSCLGQAKLSLRSPLSSRVVPSHSTPGLRGCYPPFSRVPYPLAGGKKKEKKRRGGHAPRSEMRPSKVDKSPSQKA